MQQQPSGRLIKVRVREITASPVVNDIVVTGISQASKKVELKAETAGRIEEVLFEEGDKVDEGSVIARIETRERKERVEEARDLVKQREIEFNAARELENKGFNSRIRLAEARAALKSAKTLLRQAEIDLEKTEITAPFEGILSSQHIEPGDFVAQGSPLYEIVDLDPVEFTGYISERSITEIEKGQKAAAIFSGGRKVQGKVSYVAPAADPDTRTFRTIIRVDNPSMDIREGLTAELRIPLSQKAAHKISSSALSLNDKGQVGVKIVEKDNHVKFVPVRIIADKSGYMLVEGLPEKVRLITVGQDFVTSGQPVEPVLSNGEELL
jgi:multidrug efflux system membrane fusion protein